MDALPSTRAAAKAAGAKRFFTGVPCPKGHLSERYTSSGVCVACHAIHNAEAAADPVARLARKEWERRHWSIPENRQAQLQRYRDYNHNRRARKRAEREAGV